MINELLFTGYPIVIILCWMIIGFIGSCIVFLLIKFALRIKNIIGYQFFKISCKKKGLDACSYCTGTGKLINRSGITSSCSYCGGKGMVDWPKKIMNGG